MSPGPVQVLSQLLRMFVIAAMVGSVWAPARSADAQSDDERARELFLAAEDEYAAGRYADAAAKYKEAYRLSRRHALLFNLGNTYERMGEYEKAADALQDYLNTPSPQRVRETRQRIKVLRKRAEEKRAQEEDRLRRLREEDDDGDGGDDFAGGGGQLVDDDPEGPSRLPSYLLIGGGGAAIVAGVVFALGSSSAGGDAEERCTQSDGGLFCSTEAESALDRERNLAIAADVSFVVGLGAVATGVVLWLIADEPGAATEAVEDDFAVGPTVLPGGGGIGVTGRF